MNHKSVWLQCFVMVLEEYYDIKRRFSSSERSLVLRAS